MSKVTIATDWLDICAGCHMSFLDIDERLVGLLDKIEITSSPITDLKEPPVEGVVVGILTGAVSNSHQLEVAKKMRERCKILVALGDCASMNGIPSMRNGLSTEEILTRAYVETESTVDGKIPRSEEIAKLFEESVPIHEVVQVDVNVPGCPPSADSIYFVIAELLEGRIPALSGSSVWIVMKINTMNGPGPIMTSQWMLLPRSMSAVRHATVLAQGTLNGRMVKNSQTAK